MKLMASYAQVTHSIQKLQLSVASIAWHFCVTDYVSAGVWYDEMAGKGPLTAEPLESDELSNSKTFSSKKQRPNKVQVMKCT